MTTLHLTLLRPEQVCKKLGLEKTKLYELMKNDPDFPKATRHSGRWVTFFECEIDEYIIKKCAFHQGVDCAELTDSLVKSTLFVNRYLAAEQQP